MKHEINLAWQGKMSFETNLDGHKIIVDAPEEAGGEDRGPRPKKLMLVALAGCTGMDVVSLLKKMRVEYTALNIKVVGNVTEEHPKHYDAMKVIYEVSGENIDVSKVEKAVNMSVDKYCGVSATYKKALDFDFEIRVNP